MLPFTFKFLIHLEQTFMAVGGWDPSTFSLALWVFFSFALSGKLSNSLIKFHEKSSWDCGRNCIDSINHFGEN